jgi:hypothetical protein
MSVSTHHSTVGCTGHRANVPHDTERSARQPSCSQATRPTRGQNKVADLAGGAWNGAGVAGSWSLQVADAGDVTRLS